MSWNFRIVRIDIEYDSIQYHSMREVYYNDDGSIKSISTEDYSVGSGFGVEGILQDLEAFKKACEKPVLTQADIPFPIND